MVHCASNAQWTTYTHLEFLRLKGDMKLNGKHPQEMSAFQQQVIASLVPVANTFPPEPEIKTAPKEQPMSYRHPQKKCLN